MKKILFLGAAPHQCSAIRHAREAGHTVFTCDNLPHNPGHRLADKTFSISVVLQEEVLALARSLEIDGVIGYGSEPCSLAAATVADALGLPGCGYPAAATLADKALFRRLLRDEGIQDVPFAVFGDGQLEDAQRWVHALGDAVVVKPADSSGSKGITIKPSSQGFAEAFGFALAASPTRRVVIESFVPRRGAQIGGDGFFEDGRLAFVCFGESFSVPGVTQPDILSKMFPASHDAASLAVLRDLIERSGRAADLKSGPVNFDAHFTPDGTPFLIEMAARNGGNFFPDIIVRQTGVNLVAAAVEIALDANWKLPVTPVVEPRWNANYMLHSRRDGVLRSLGLAAELQPHVAEFHPYTASGTRIHAFAKAGDAIGAVILRFDSRSQMEEVMKQMSRLCHVELEADA